MSQILVVPVGRSVAASGVPAQLPRPWPRPPRESTVPRCSRGADVIVVFRGHGRRVYGPCNLPRVVRLLGHALLRHPQRATGLVARLSFTERWTHGRQHTWVVSGDRSGRTLAESNRGDPPPQWRS